MSEVKQRVGRDTPEELASSLLGGNRRSLSRLISWAENGAPGFPAALAGIYHATGGAWRVGITGPPGAGKSTLVNELAHKLREHGDHHVGILAVDPSSPFTGGALLGDRIRMDELTGDPKVYIRSMASRKSHGGMARAGVDACDVMDAFGMDRILIETVGVGQAEYDVMGACDTVVVVMCPGAGDGIQAMKAGILEVADVLVVNKSDLPGSDRLYNDLSEAAHVRAARPAAAGHHRACGTEGSGNFETWQVPVVRASAGRGEGILGDASVLEAIANHRAYLEANGLDAIRQGKRAKQVRRIVDDELDQRVWNKPELEERVTAALRSGATSYDIARELVVDLIDGLSAGSSSGQTAEGGSPGKTA
ncbi:MAG: methylmalonyl Co-A mutase-associated GTPase MeaB [Planctomycetota bacterium]|nr:methylmalonyl Co-A mutase-associated GTPase MeaB [Planctomycetota bacterium]